MNESSREPRVCPVCNGTGLVSRPPGVAGDQPSWVSTGVGPYRCRSCGGEGWINVPPVIAACDDPACDIPFAERPHTHDWPEAL